jgi:hypothetical protein
MVASRMLALALVSAGGTNGLAAELVAVNGSRTRFASAIEGRIGGAPVRLVLTGGALRQKAIFNVYAVGSYLQEGAPVRTAGELAAADRPKQLHLVMERDIPGETMVEAFTEAVRLNNPAPAFVPELEALGRLLRPRTIQKGDHIWLTHVPQVGIHCRVVGKGEILIRNPRFSRAVWEIYLGEKNLGESIKQGLVSRL